MNFITKRFGAKRALASSTIAAEMATISGGLAKAKTRLPEVEDTLANPAALTDSDHEAAELECAALKRGIARMQAQLSELQTAFTKAQAGERLVDLKARAEALRRRVDSDIPKALDRYERAGREVAAAVAAYDEVATAVDAMNAELRRAGLPDIETPHRRFRCIPGSVTPERREKRKKWVRRVRVPVYDADGKPTGWREEYQESAGIVFSLKDGKHVPNDPSLFEVDYEHVEPERRGDDVWLPSLSHNVSLPSAQAGSEQLWPRKR
ncbi:hypothetical protein [Bosea sp. MMO-172]|uniref:hypothetical protein n=1 Tax=Bosea sp. MMO-172 TaxID=3127885 RepID=UPI0030188041